MCAVHYTDLQKIYVTKYLIIFIHSFATFMSNFRFITPNIIKNFDPYIQIDNVENVGFLVKQNTEIRNLHLEWFGFTILPTLRGEASKGWQIAIPYH